MFLSSADGIVDLAGDFTIGVSSPADLAGDVTVGVASSAVAGVSSPADFAEVASLAYIAEVASSADLAEVVSSAGLAGYVTVGVTSSADTVDVVTTGVAFQEKRDVPSGSVIDYDDSFYDGHYDENLDYFDYDDPGDFDS